MVIKRMADIALSLFPTSNKINASIVLSYILTPCSGRFENPFSKSRKQDSKCFNKVNQGMDSEENKENRENAAGCPDDMDQAAGTVRLGQDFFHINQP